MTNKVQRMFNWQGRSMWKTKDNMVKSSFQTTNICKLVVGKIHANAFSDFYWLEVQYILFI